MGFHLKRKNLRLQIWGPFSTELKKRRPRPRRYHFLKCVHGVCWASEYTKFAGIPCAFHGWDFLLGPVSLVLSYVISETSSYFGGDFLQSQHHKPSQEILPILPHQTSVSWHPNIFKIWASVKMGEPKPHPRRFNLGKSFEVILEPLTLELLQTGRSFSWFFFWDDWLKHIKTTLMIKKRKGECSSDESDKRVQVCVVVSCILAVCAMSLLIWYPGWLHDYKTWYKTRT